MKTVCFDRLASSAPMNADAAKAVSMRGETEPDCKLPEGLCHWEVPPKTTPVPSNAEDFTGRRRGKITVVGYLYSAAKGGGGARWLVRCACGRYEVRSGKTIRKGTEATPDQCKRCNRNRQLRRQAHFDATGRWPA